MEENDARIVFETLVNHLTELKLGWVVDQVNERIRLGKLISKDVSVTRDAHGKIGRKRKASFVTTVPFTAKERLSILIDAIDHVAIQTGQMGAKVVEHLHEKGFESVEFYPDPQEDLENPPRPSPTLFELAEDPVERTRAHVQVEPVVRIHVDSLRERGDARMGLAVLLSELKAEIGRGSG